MSLKNLENQIKNCRICKDSPLQKYPLGHEPNPVLYISQTAKIALAGQAPGNLVHRTHIPFNDPSGDRLREWLGFTKEIFYDKAKIAIIPMGFCFPGYSEKGADLPPRLECKKKWHDILMKTLGNIELVLAIGCYAQNYHIKKNGKKTMSENIRLWQEIYAEKQPNGYYVLPLPHPSWRNNIWLKKNPWFVEETLPEMRKILLTKL